MPSRFAVIQTNKGTIKFELLEEDAPKTTENFRLLAEKGYYDGIIFHRVIKGFMIQGGDPTGTGRGGQSAWGGRFDDEINPSSDVYQRGYKAGTVAMANAGPNTNGSQFFIMHVDYPLPPSYTIFGRVTEGQDVVNAIATSKTDRSDRPVDEVKMERVTIEESQRDQASELTIDDPSSFVTSEEGTEASAAATTTTPQVPEFGEIGPPLAGFTADFWTGEDLLDITRDVNALASLVAATSIDPPLSIGLFGDWGSGKSHFMRQMKSRVEKLSQRARESGKPQSELGYHKRIVQIEFNAWHYIEGNLWASLVEHIFNSLQFAEQKDGKSHVNDARLTIMEKLGLKQELQKRIEERQQELQNQAAAAKQRVEEANAKRDDKSQDLAKLRQKTETAMNELPSVSVSIEQIELLKHLGLPAGALYVPAEIHKKYQEVQTFFGYIRAQWAIFKSDPKRINKLIQVMLVVVAAIIVGLLLRKLLATALAYVASIVTFLLGAWATIKPYVEKLQKSMVTLKEKYEDVEQERQKKIIALESEVNWLTREMAAAKNEANAIDNEVAKLHIELNATDAAKLMADFIEDRAACSDYRRHLGVLALIRRDFEKLSQLLSEQATIDESRPDKNSVSRIILYIDDLDRCPPKNVVQVLQAIHLLLAFPLFVVIVGVDARWVTRSLQESYDWLVADEEAEGREHDKQNNKGTPDRVVVTPHDYLEKIFQIPFWLKPLGATECKSLLIGLTNNSRSASGQNDVEPPPSRLAITVSRESAMERPNTPEGPVSFGAPVTESTYVPAVSDSLRADQSAAATKTEEQIDLAPKSLALTDVEIDYMTKLAPLIKRSPRAVKRFLNCYRLIKVNLRPNQLEAFIGTAEQPGQFTAVMILLGVITGAPSMSLPLIEELETYSYGAKATNLNTFLEQLGKHPTVVKQQDWALIKDFLEDHIGSDGAEPTFASLIEITSQVSRYSFRVARATQKSGVKTKEPKVAA